jgi:hypothetical protein
MRKATAKKATKATKAKVVKKARAPRKPKLIGFSTRIETRVAKQLKLFSKKNKLTISDVVNSSIRVFISEAETLVAELDKDREDIFGYRRKYTGPKAPGRTTDVYATEDAVRAMKKK